VGMSLLKVVTTFALIVPDTILEAKNLANSGLGSDNSDLNIFFI